MSRQITKKHSNGQPSSLSSGTLFGSTQPGKHQSRHSRVASLMDDNALTSRSIHYRTNSAFTPYTQSAVPNCITPVLNPSSSLFNKKRSFEDHQLLAPVADTASVIPPINIAHLQRPVEQPSTVRSRHQRITSMVTHRDPPCNHQSTVSSATLTHRQLPRRDSPLEPQSSATRSLKSDIASSESTFRKYNAVAGKAAMTNQLTNQSSNTRSMSMHQSMTARSAIPYQSSNTRSMSVYQNMINRTRSTSLNERPNGDLMVHQSSGVRSARSASLHHVSSSRSTRMKPLRTRSVNNLPRGFSSVNMESHHHSDNTSAGHSFSATARAHLNNNYLAISYHMGLQGDSMVSILTDHGHWQPLSSGSTDRQHHEQPMFDYRLGSQLSEVQRDAFVLTGGVGLQSRATAHSAWLFVISQDLARFTVELLSEDLPPMAFHQSLYLDSTNTLYLHGYPYAVGHPEEQQPTTIAWVFSRSEQRVHPVGMTIIGTTDHRTEVPSCGMIMFLECWRDGRISLFLIGGMSGHDHHERAGPSAQTLPIWSLGIEAQSEEVPRWSRGELAFDTGSSAPAGFRDKLMGRVPSYSSAFHLRGTSQALVCCVGLREPLAIDLENFTWSLSGLHFDRQFQEGSFGYMDDASLSITHGPLESVQIDTSKECWRWRQDTVSQSIRYHSYSSDIESEVSSSEPILSDLCKIARVDPLILDSDMNDDLSLSSCMSGLLISIDEDDQEPSLTLSSTRPVSICSMQTKKWIPGNHVARVVSEFESWTNNNSMDCCVSCDQSEVNQSSEIIRSSPLNAMKTFKLADSENWEEILKQSSICSDATVTVIKFEDPSTSNCNTDTSDGVNASPGVLRKELNALRRTLTRKELDVNELAARLKNVEKDTARLYDSMTSINETHLRQSPTPVDTDHEHHADDHAVVEGETPTSMEDGTVASMQLELAQAKDTIIEYEMRQSDNHSKLDELEQLRRLLQDRDHQVSELTKQKTEWGSAKLKYEDDVNLLQEKINSLMLEKARAERDHRSKLESLANELEDQRSIVARCEVLRNEYEDDKRSMQEDFDRLMVLRSEHEQVVALWNSQHKTIDEEAQREDEDLASQKAEPPDTNAPGKCIASVSDTPCESCSKFCRLLAHREEKSKGYKNKYRNLLEKYKFLKAESTSEQLLKLKRAIKSELLMKI